MTLRLAGFLDRVRTGFWAVPAACVAVAIALAVGLVALDRSLSDDLGRLTFGAGPDGAREVLSAITTSMITFTGLVFSITIVVLQLTSSQFSPRVLRTFLRDRQTQLSLGVFIATFVYAVLVLRTVNGLDDDTFVPAVATTVGMLLLLVSVGVFVGYIHHIATAIQVSSILQSIWEETRDVLEKRFPRGLTPTPAVARPRGTPVAELPSTGTGVLTGVDAPTLVRLACDADVVLVSDLAVGGFVPEGAPMVEVHGGNAEALQGRSVVRAFGLAPERTMQADVAFGFRQLVDISTRALSPGVNDPTTAVQALDKLHDLLRRLVTRSFPTAVHADAEGRIRLHLPPPLLEDYLARALDEAEHYGGDVLQVNQRIDSMLADLRAAALPEHRAVLDARLAARG